MVNGMEKGEEKKVVIGAGMAGLGAYFADNEINIYESRNSPGGLCDGFEIDGFYFDQAVHLSFSDNLFIKETFCKDYIKHQPESLSWFHEKWLRHPAQNNLYPCEVEEKIKAIEGFVNREKVINTTNFELWAKSQYGYWLYDNMFKPYNEKYWCIDLSKLGTRWIGNRIYRPSLEEILYGSYTQETPNTYYAKEMRYPIKGRYLSFLDKIIQKAENEKRIKYQKKVVKIDTGTKSISFESGETIKYDCIYSSIPMTEIVKIVDGVPDYILKKTEELEYTSIALVSFGFNRVIDFDRIWFYIYDKDIYAARAHLPSLKSVNNVPKEKSSIQFEIYFNSKKKMISSRDCIDNCKYALKKLKIASNEDIVLEDFRVVPYGNVIFKNGTEEISNEIRKFLSKRDIIPIGRFGRWEYLWSDQAFLSGYNAVKEDV